MNASVTNSEPSRGRVLVGATNSHAQTWIEVSDDVLARLWDAGFETRYPSDQYLLRGKPIGSPDILVRHGASIRDLVVNQGVLPSLFDNEHYQTTAVYEVVYGVVYGSN